MSSNINDTLALYNIRHWGEGYYDVSEQGHLVARPLGPDAPGRVDLYELAGKLAAQGLAPPVLVRLLDVLHHRLDTLHRAFDTAMVEYGYGGGFTPVFPIKVNQQHEVVHEIVEYGGAHVGLEAGSKPELMAVLGLAGRDNPRLVICNGYKDRNYIRLALLGRRLGHRVFLVIEKPSELERVLEEADRLGIEPLLGMRLRLASIGQGKWQNTGGERSKFGLSASQVLELLDRLSASGRLSCLTLMHFHLGSQLANIRDIKRGLDEAARYYAQLRRLGVPVQLVDVGGGLGVDYEGTASRSFCSVNYGVAEYAGNVVHAFHQVCRSEDLPPPHLITESGRAMSAHHALLITRVVDVERAPGNPLPPVHGEREPPPLQDLRRSLERLSARNAMETFHNAGHALDEVHTQFSQGFLELSQRARAEALYATVCQGVRGHLNPRTLSHREVLDELNEKLADKYICNFSLFRSLPDAWAIDQVFPVVPLHRLTESPDRRGIVHDLTCDSDGQVRHYVSGDGIESNLPLHQVRPGQPYLLGIFMVGAYQEILGDIHNLFGETHSVNVRLENSGYRVSEPRHGQRVADVLRQVRFDPADLLGTYQRMGETAGLTPQELEVHLEGLRAGLEGYTYLSGSEGDA